MPCKKNTKKLLKTIYLSIFYSGIKIFLKGVERKSLQESKTAGFNMADTSISMPSGMGGLMRYSEEYQSKFPISPASVIVFVFLIIGFRILLSFIY